MSDQQNDLIVVEPSGDNPMQMLVEAVLDDLGSDTSRRVYQTSINQFFDWLDNRPNSTVNKGTVAAFKRYLEEERGLAAATVNRHLDNDPDFVAAYNEANDSYRDVPMAEVKRRGVDGWLEPVYGKDGRVYEFKLNRAGQPVYRTNADGEEVPVMVPSFIRKYSDSLLILEAKRVDPNLH